MNAFDRLNAAVAEVNRTGRVEFQWPLHEPEMNITLEKNMHIVFIWLGMGGKSRDIGPGELLRLMATFE